MMNDLPHKTGVERMMEAQVIQSLLPQMREALHKWALPQGWSVTLIAHESDAPPDDVTMQMVTSEIDPGKLLLVFNDLLATMRAAHTQYLAQRQAFEQGELGGVGDNTPYGKGEQRHGFAVFKGGKDVADSIEGMAPVAPTQPENDNTE